MRRVSLLLAMVMLLLAQGCSEGTYSVPRDHGNDKDGSNITFPDGTPRDAAEDGYTGSLQRDHDRGWRLADLKPVLRQVQIALAVASRSQRGLLLAGLRF